ncbi:GGDEF domain-containing protein [Pseudomonas saudiphocaensis]|uniref:GGDEF domain-containing protein n=1 Tax=Pseudomonas saudiphocaensis TaxID=1499686 RepID=UPI00187D3625|nr:GGDEF domain-containing protein [Pseudomonas saudiphocaensis]MBE7927534.1 GGDEF domain-containing protein [Pseudomonas saudiphocaensis]
MPRLSAVRFSHFYAPLALLVGGVVAARQSALNDFFTSLFNVLPTVLLLLGAAFCCAYGRAREAFLLLVVYLVYFLLDTQVDHYRATGTVLPEAALTFHLCSVLLPVLFGLYGAWQERTQMLQECLARLSVLLVVSLIAFLLAWRSPERLLEWLAVVRWPGLYADWLSLIQLAYPLFLLAFVVMVVQYLRQPRPVHAAQFVALVGLLMMLPQVFKQPGALNVLSSVVMLILVVSIAQEAYQMAFRDELTGLPGRRALNERLQRLGRHYVIAMADVDHFKAFNDTHGHDVGDQVLRLVASRLRKIGGGGRAYRYGGEEFTLVFPGRNLDDCLPHLEAVRQAVESYRMQLRDKANRPKAAQQGKRRRGSGSGSQVSVTISIGVAERLLEQRNPEEVIKAADQALYSAKNAGRNCIRAFGQNRRGAVRTPKPAATEA